MYREALLRASYRSSERSRETSVARKCLEYTLGPHIDMLYFGQQERNLARGIVETWVLAADGTGKLPVATHKQIVRLLVSRLVWRRD